MKIEFIKIKKKVNILMNKRQEIYKSIFKSIEYKIQNL